MGGLLELIAEGGGWSWLITGLILLGLELLLPLTFLLWFGVAALIVGAITLFVDWPWQLQFLTFGALGLILFFATRVLLGTRGSKDTDQPFLNQRAARYVGRTVRLEGAIETGEGHVRLDDTIWRVKGPDLPAGTSVKIISAEGSTFTVEPIEAS